MTGTPAGYERSDGWSTIVYPNIYTAHIRELSLWPGIGWQRADLTAAASSSVLASSNDVSAYIRSDGASAVVVATGSSPAPYVRSDRLSTVVYRGTDNHIYELSRNTNGTWSSADLSVITGAPAASGHPVGYVRADGMNAVTYKSSSGHVIELALNGQWGSADLSSIVGATDSARLVYFGPRPYTRPDGVSAVIYVDASGRIQELSLAASGGGWSINSLSALTGVTTRVAVPYLRGDGVAAVLYINTDSHVNEAALESNGWVVTDLTATAGAPNALFPSSPNLGSIVNGYVRGDGLTTVVYLAASPARDVIELARVGSGWQFADLSQLVGGQ